MDEGLEAFGLREADLAGLTVDDIDALATDHVLAADATLTLTDIAERLGVPTVEVRTIWRALGLPFDERERVFGEQDVELISTLREATDAVFELEEGLEMLRVVGASLARVTDALVSEYVRNPQRRLEEAGASPTRALVAGLTATTLALQLGRSLGVVFRHHMRLAVQNQRRGQQAVAQRELTRVGIGFVDLVGFTSLSRELPVGRVAGLITDFERRAYEAAADHRARIVKHIGDEVMFVAFDPAATCALGLDLLSTTTEAGIDPRGGLAYGEAIAMHGDFYGWVPNLASRLTDHATPGELLVDRGLVEALGEERGFEPAGRRMLKGFAEPVPVWSVRPLDCR